MAAHRPLPAARRHAARLASELGSEIDTARSALALPIDELARRASVASSTVSRVLKGDSGTHLDTLCAVAAVVGLRIGVRAFPAQQPSLRDSGQLRIVNHLVAQAHPSLRPALEVPVGDPFGRAADLVLFGPEEIIHTEVERRLNDLQAPYRAARVKRDALQARHSRPVRLVLAVEDTARNRAVVAPHAELIRTAMPARPAEILSALRNGTTLGRDGLLWVRPWRQPVIATSRR